MSKKIVATHSGKYHTDDLFAVSTIQILLGEDNVEVIRTRDVEEIKKADYVVDIGGVNDSDTEHFDHHQTGGAGTRKNGVPYASFGLVWKKYGEKLAGGFRQAHIVDEKLVQPIDADDNGYPLFLLTDEKILPYKLNTMLSAFRPTWKERQNYDEIFMEMLPLTRKILKREIELAGQFIEVEGYIQKTYEESDDKQIIVFGEDQQYGREPIGNVLCTYPEPLFAIVYRPEQGAWQTLAIKKSFDTFESRKRLTEEWGGNKSPEELQKLTGFPDVIFVHNNGFLALSKSKETALGLARLSMKK